MTTKYVAKDGKEFYNEKECIAHEITNEVNYLKEHEGKYVCYRVKEENLFSKIELPSLVECYGMEFFRVKYDNQEQKNIVKAYIKSYYDYDFDFDEYYDAEFKEPQEFIVVFDGCEWLSIYDGDPIEEMKEFVKALEPKATKKK